MIEKQQQQHKLHLQGMNNMNMNNHTQAQCPSDCCRVAAGANPSTVHQSIAETHTGTNNYFTLKFIAMPSNK